VYDGVGITVRCLHTVFGCKPIHENGDTPIVAVHHDPKHDNSLGSNRTFWKVFHVAFRDGGGTIFEDFPDAFNVVAHKLAHTITEYLCDRILGLIHGPE
jgi:Zn-dependent metalloprotease